MTGCSGRGKFGDSNRKDYGPRELFVSFFDF
jgi:hypothetical protein